MVRSALAVCMDQRAPRLDVVVHAVLKAERIPKQLAEITEISETGLSAKASYVAPSLGERVLFVLENGEMLVGTVRWGIDRDFRVALDDALCSQNFKNLQQMGSVPA